VTRVDWIALAIAGLAALSGLRRGLIATALSLGGLAAGAVLGARLAPQFLHGGSASPYTPLAGLVGAVIGAAILQTVASIAGSFARGSLLVVPPLRMLDAVGGLVAGAALGLATVWVAGAVLLQLPGQPGLRREVQRSLILQRLNRVAPPSTVLRAFARFDPFPRIAGPAPPSVPPDRRVLTSGAVRDARPSVVKITAVACGLGVEGTGFFVAPHIVATAAHVVAGAHDVEVGGTPAQVVAFDKGQDVALLGTSRSTRVLRLVDPRAGSSMVILGYPENGPFDARPGRVGATADVLVNGSLREVTAISGLVRHGNSGGPVVDVSGDVQGLVFAARVGSSGGYAVPSQVVRSILRRPHSHAVGTGSC
jgi:S1-C subfamily serine protease